MDTPTEEDLERFARSPRAYYPSQPIIETDETVQPSTSQPEDTQLSQPAEERPQGREAFTLEITSCPNVISRSERFTIGVRLTYNADPLGRGRPVLLGARPATHQSPQTSSSSSTQASFPLHSLPSDEYPFPDVSASDLPQPQQSALSTATVKIFPGQSVTSRIEIDPAQWNLREGTTYRLLSLGAEVPAPQINSWRWGTLEDLRTNPIPIANEAYDLNGQIIILARSNTVQVSVRP